MNPRRTRPSAPRLDTTLLVIAEFDPTLDVTLGTRGAHAASAQIPARPRTAAVHHTVDPAT